MCPLRTPCLTPRIAEPLALHSSNPAPDGPAGRTVTSPLPRRSTSVPWTEVLRRGNGEVTVRRCRWERAVGDAAATVSPKTAKSPASWVVQERTVSYLDTPLEAQLH